MTTTNRLVAALCLLSLLTACGQPLRTSPTRAAHPETAASTAAEALSSPQDSSATSDSFVTDALTPMATSSKSNSSLAYETGVPSLNAEQEQLLWDFMHSYFASLSKLEVQNISKLFSTEAAKQAKDVMDVWDVDVSIRKLHKMDLKLTGYAFRLTLREVTKRQNGDVYVRTMENNVQNFAAYPGVDSQTYRVGHTFVMTKTKNGWKLTEHDQYSGSNNVLTGRSFGQTTVTYNPISKQDLLAQAKTDIVNRPSQGTASGKEPPEHDYNRQAAVAYAKNWVGQRNSDWSNYDHSGGNCMNFVSQALYAGGIPMDSTGTAQWKRYSNSLNNSPTATGRSASWASVSSFLAYARSNTGFGLVSGINEPFYSGQPGDVILLGTSKGYRHIVMISQVMTDKDGNVIDYLVCSNTMDLRDYPVSAYHYTRQVLVKIYGWNGSTTQAS